MPSHRTVFEREAPDARLVDAALAGSRPSVFWWDDVPPPEPCDPFDGLVGADLAVVGGGYCGLWTALLAKRRNPSARVVLLEAETIGWAASGRNGGFVEASITHGEANGEQRWPDEQGTLLRLGTENLDAFCDDVTSLGLDAQLERTGMLTVAVEPHQLEWLAEAGGEVLNEAAVRAEVASPTYLGGAWSRDTCALVHPVRLATELARAALEAGVEMHEHTRVEELDARGRYVALHTPRGTLRAERVALATNVFPSLVRRWRHFTVPVYDYVLATEPLSTEQRSSIGWEHRQGVGDMANQFHYYRQTADHRIVWGGYDAIYPRGGGVDAAHEERPQTFRRLAAHFLTTFPQLEGVGFTHRWAGAIDTSTQFCAFHALTHRGRVAHAAGFTGLGVGATRFAAEVMLDRLSGASTERTGLQMVRRMPLPFPPEPFASVGINLTRRSLDRADHRRGRRDLFLRTLDRLGLGFDS